MENLQGMPSDEYKTLMLLQKNNVQLYTHDIKLHKNQAFPISLASVGITHVLEFVQLGDS